MYNKNKYKLIKISLNNIIFLNNMFIVPIITVIEIGNYKLLNVFLK